MTLLLRIGCVRGHLRSHLCLQCKFYTQNYLFRISANQLATMHCNALMTRTSLRFSGFAWRAILNRF